MYRAIKVMRCLKYIILGLYFTAVTPIGALAANVKGTTIRGKIFIKVEYTSEAKCSKDTMYVSLSRMVKNPKYSPTYGTEQYIYKSIVDTDSKNNYIGGDIKRGYCEYILNNIPTRKGRYRLTTVVKDEAQFPNNAPAYCTVSPVYSESISWKNPISTNDFGQTKDMELTRVVAKCQP
jgi:hypothetical protein